MNCVHFAMRAEFIIFMLKSCTCKIVRHKIPCDEVITLNKMPGYHFYSDSDNISASCIFNVSLYMSVRVRVCVCVCGYCDTLHACLCACLPLSKGA